MNYDEAKELLRGHLMVHRHNQKWSNDYRCTDYLDNMMDSIDIILNKIDELESENGKLKIGTICKGK